MTDLTSFVQQVSVTALPLIFAVTLHEAAHGFAANALGDDTAKRLGRISLNPARHVDPFGTLILPAILMLLGDFLFGWAKPVPVNYMRLRNPRYGMVLVALAGPFANILMAILAIILMRWVGELPRQAVDWARLNLANGIFLNLLFFVFNMIPLPPLDGGRVAVGVLPRRLAIPLARLEDKGVLILLALLVILPLLGRLLDLPLDPFQAVIAPAITLLLEGLVFLFGVS